MNFWRLVPLGAPLDAALHVHHDKMLVTVSAGIAVVAAFTALAVVDRIIATTSPRAARAWLALGAVAMGTGVWAMHFTAMLSLRLPVAVSYDPALTALSLLPAVAGSGVAIHVLSRPSTSRWPRPLAAVPMVLGIAVMHFTGMEAAQAGARLMYRPITFLLSLVVCYGLAVAALAIRPALDRMMKRTAVSHVLSAVVMGLAVTGMHHTAMAAAVFVPIPGAAVVAPGISSSLLAVLVCLGTIVVVGLTLVGTLIDARMAHVSSSLKWSETRHRTVLESMSDGVFTLTQEGTIESVNPAGAAAFGYEAADMCGLSFNTLLPAAGAALTAGRAGIATFGRRRDGSDLPVEVTLTAMTIQGKQLLSAVVRDATVQRRHQEAITEHIQRLEEVSESLRRQSRELERERDRAHGAVRAKSEFLATMSHEIRTPLNGIIGITELLLESRLTSDQLEQMRMIRISGEALLHVINQILDFSKIEAGRLTLDRAGFDVAGLLDAVRVLIAPIAERKFLPVRVRTAGQPPRLVGDPFRLQQIVLNLASNAVKFTDRGSVTLEAECVPDGALWRIRITARDTGIGIDAATQARLFAPFAQADSSTTRRYGGTGLGLIICKRLIESMGGTIGVDSTPGEGSAFWIELALPVEAALDAQAAALAAMGAASTALPVEVGGWRVLVVEDNATNQKVATFILQAFGCDVQVAGDGAQGFAAWKSGWFDLILMDCQMPVMDGFEAARAIREAEPPGVRTPIIALTANAMEGDRTRCLAAGMDEYVAKPLTRLGLRRAFEGLIAEGRLQPAQPVG